MGIHELIGLWLGSNIIVAAATFWIVSRQCECNDELDPAIDAIFNALPPSGSMMSEKRKRRWMTSARAILDIVYPDDAPPKKKQ